MTQPEPQDAKGWYQLGCQQYEASDYDTALASFEKALTFDDKDYQTWHKRSDSLWRLERYKEAITSYNNAFEITPKQLTYDWGIEVEKFGCYEDLITECDKALKIQPNCYMVLIGRANALYELGRYEEAIINFNQALEISPNYYLAWAGRGNALLELGCYEKAIADYDRALEENIDIYYNFINNRGVALKNLGYHKKAIADYQKCLEYYHKAWDLNQELFTNLYRRGVVWENLGRSQNAIDDYLQAVKLQPSYWPAWNQLGWIRLNLKQYSDAIETWDQGLKNLRRENIGHQRGFGELYYSIGKAYHQVQIRPDDGLKAIENFKKAREVLKERFPERALEVLQDMIQVCRKLDRTQEVKGLLNEGTEELRAILQRPDFIDAHKIRLARKFAGFNQLGVDQLVQSNQPINALNLAESHKNTSLHWCQGGWINIAPQSPNYSEIRQLLPSRTAAIYWHLSPTALTTFIVKKSENRPLILGVDKPLDLLRIIPGLTPPPPNPHIIDNQMSEFKRWMDTWKQDYQTYRASETPTNHDWYTKMPDRLQTLDRILKIAEIKLHLSGIDQLILIPHRDLHLLPLNHLFLNYTVTNLPSAQIGLSLQNQPATIGNLQSLLILEDPETNQPIPQLEFLPKLLFAEIESAAISCLYSNSKRIENSNATKIALEDALRSYPDIFHFTGHGYNDINQPLESALVLAGEDWLTLRHIFERNFVSPNMVCLSACETGLTSRHNVIDEYVGIVSGFLKAGAAYVVSTLWTVDEVSTALIMICFHQFLKKGIAPAKALKEAQKWLSTVTYKNLIIWYRSLATKVANYDLGCYENLQGLASITQRKLDSMETDTCPYQHPYYWAGFTITGKVNLPHA